MTFLGAVHTGCGILSLIIGAWIFVARKGTRAHIRCGWAYVASMLVLNLTALCIYNLTGRFNTFHALAVFSLLTVAVGIAQVLPKNRWRNWIWRHYQYMSWSYVGLLAATINESFVHIPPLSRLAAATDAPLPLLVMTAVLLISAIFIHRMQSRTLARYDPHRPRNG